MKKSPLHQLQSLDPSQMRVVKILHPMAVGSGFQSGVMLSPGVIWRFLGVIKICIFLGLEQLFEICIVFLA